MNSLSYKSRKPGQKISTNGIKLPGISLATLSLASCGGEVPENNHADKLGVGFPDSYVSPKSNYLPPQGIDPNYEILQSAYSEPYWVAALEMAQPEIHVTPMLEDFERVIEYTFPDAQPAYYHHSVTEWQPATEEMRTATREILFRFEEILDVSIVEGTEPAAANIISVGRSNQVMTSGVSYFPNNFYELGMDVFIAKDYASPKFTSELITNFDYEVLVHELGHAFGLKHPFAEEGSNTKILSAF